MNEPAEMDSPVLEIKRAAVIGAGVMGSQIAAMLANVGIGSILLDTIPKEPNELERKAGLGLEDREVRDRIVREQFARTCKLSPPAFFSPENATLVEIGNVEDDLDRLDEVDWVIEAVTERLEVKEAILKKISARARSDTVITTNTSGIPIAVLAESLPESRRKHFFGAHFFNPPRYMRLLEMIPAPQTDPELFKAFALFADHALGKGVVVCKDSPGFISNRIGFFAIQHAIWLMSEEGMSVDEVDAVTGPAMGRPRSATFRLADIVGLDVLDHIGRDLIARLKGDAMKKYFEPTRFMKEMMKRGWMGEKSGQGFYKRVKGDSGAQIVTLDPVSMEYGPRKEADFESLKMLARLGDTPERIRELCSADDRAGRFAWNHLSSVICYAAEKLEEIAHDLPSVDRVMRWGFGWELGPFEIWDALGVAQTASRLETEGRAVPAVVQRVLDAGKCAFYEVYDGKYFHFDLGRKAYVRSSREAGAVHLNLIRAGGGLVTGNNGASLLDIGDGVGCVQFHSKMNVLGPDQLDILEESFNIAPGRFEGLVIGNQGPHFSAGVNLKLFVDQIEKKDWGGIDKLLQRFQRVTGAIRRQPKPVVVACHGYTLGGGCELVQGCDHVLAAAETYMGLPEVKVGLIPAAGGCKEMLIRALEEAFRLKNPKPFSVLKPAWEAMLKARISSSAEEIFHFHYLDRMKAFVILNPEVLLAEAKSEVLLLGREGYEPAAERRMIPALGSEGIARFEEVISKLREKDEISEYDAVVGEKLAYVLCGGRQGPGSTISEQGLLDLEREAFLSLCGNAKTLARLKHMLEVGKPLRN